MLATLTAAQLTQLEQWFGRQRFFSRSVGPRTSHPRYLGAYLCASCRRGLAGNHRRSFPPAGLGLLRRNSDHPVGGRHQHEGNPLPVQGEHGSGYDPDEQGPGNPAGRSAGGC